jgi:hypothetical protein
MAVAWVGDGEAGAAALGAEQEKIARAAAAASDLLMSRTTGTRGWGYVERQELGRGCRGGV